jgi:hypothetical protein
VARGRHGIAATRAEKETMLLDIFEIAKARSVIELISRPLVIGAEVGRIALHPHRTGPASGHQARSTATAGNRASRAGRPCQSTGRLLHRTAAPAGSART